MPVASPAMVDGDGLGRALSFGAIAEEYDRYRPGPPPPAVEWVLPRRRDVAVEIGAGTGALTRRLVGIVGRVIAVEPDLRMGAVLAQRVPRATVLCGRAEELPLGDRSADAVVGSSMWHWVDETRGAREAARVLRPGGTLGLLWTGPDRSLDWVGELMAWPGRGEAARLEDDRERRRRRQVHLPDDVPFEEPETTVVSWSLPLTPDELVGLVCTYSRYIVLPEPEKTLLRDELVRAVHDHPVLAGRQVIDLPMHCACWRAVRRP
jgi:SAM-dependent methyltransferase